MPRGMALGKHSMRRMQPTSLRAPLGCCSGGHRPRHNRRLRPTNIATRGRISGSHCIGYSAGIARKLYIRGAPPADLGWPTSPAKHGKTRSRLLAPWCETSVLQWWGGDSQRHSVRFGEQHSRRCIGEIRRVMRARNMYTDRKHARKMLRLPASVPHYRCDNNELGTACGRCCGAGCPSNTDPGDSYITRSIGGAECATRIS